MSAPDDLLLPRWGESGTRALPSAVRDFAPEPAMHGPLLAALGVDPGGGADAVFSSPLREPVDPSPFGSALSPLLRKGLALQPALGGARAALKRTGEHAFSELVPRLGWRERTRNAVLNACGGQPWDVFAMLRDASVGDLLALPGLGSLTLFDLLGSVEAAVLPAADDPPRAAAAALPAWGEPCSRILPAVLRDWAAGAPGSAAALLEALQLPPGTDPAGFFDVPAAEPFDTAAIRGGIEPLLDLGLADKPAMGSAWQDVASVAPEELVRAFRAMRLRTRTRNLVGRTFGGDGMRDWLLGATVRDVLAIRQLGMVSFFDLLASAEAAAQNAAGASDAPPRPAAPAPGKPALPDWAGAVTADDPRFRPLLGPAADLAELHDRAGPADLRRLADSIADAERRLADLSARTLEQEAASVLRAALGPQGDRWTAALAPRYGLSGDTPWTLEQVGAAMGVTRERVRQVQSRAASRLPARPVHAPAIDQALEMLGWTLPCSPGELAEALTAAGLSELPAWSAEALCAAVTLTGRTLELEERGGIVGRPEQLRAAKAAQAAARALSNMHGTADAAAVAARVARDTGEHVPAAELLPVLRGMPGLTWIGPDRFWAEHPPGRNRLVNTSLRILAVISPQTLEDMLGGIERDFAYRASSELRYADLVAPAASTLEAFYGSHAAFRLTGDGRVEAAEPVPFELLGEEKQALVTVLREQPWQAMDRLSLLAACEEIGMSSATIGVWTTYAECLKRFGPNVWGLRGADVPNSAVAELQARARQTRRSTDRTKVAGSTPSGRPWVARRITPTFVYSGVMPFDWGQDQLADRSLAAVDMVDGESAGTLRFARSFNWGYSVFLRRHRPAPGTVLRALADPDAGVCYLELGGDELLGEPFDA